MLFVVARGDVVVGIYPINWNRHVVEWYFYEFVVDIGVR